MKELSFSEINEVSGAGDASAGLGLVSGVLALGAIASAEVPPVAGFLALGSVIFAIGSAGASLAGY